jgi:hypothetical protein
MSTKYEYPYLHYTQKHLSGFAPLLCARKGGMGFVNAFVGSN